MINKPYDKIKIKPWDWFLLIGITMAPMTSLRIWKIGPAEVICLICGFRFLLISKIRITPLFKFFAFFLLAMVLGTIIGIVKTPRETSAIGIFTWIYFAFVSITVYSGLSINLLEYNEKLLRTFTCMACILYSFLCLYAVYVGKTFFGLQLWYGRVRFTGGATNPHQVAEFICVILLLLLRDIIKYKRFIFNILGIAGCFFILNKTSSTTAIVSSMAGVFAYIFFYFCNRFPRTKKLLYIETALLLALIIFVFYNKIIQLFLSWLAEDTNGMGRLELLRAFPDTFWKSPLLGLGPGSHAYGVMEYHNSYTEVLAATGLLGFTVFFVFSKYLFILCKYDYTFISLLVALYVFGLGGFGMRRLIYWSIMVLMMCIMEQERALKYRILEGKQQLV